MRKDVLPTTYRAAKTSTARTWPSCSRTQSLKPSAHFLVTGFKLWYFPSSPSAHLSQLLSGTFVWANILTTRTLDSQARTGKVSPDFSAGELHLNNTVLSNYMGGFIFHRLTVWFWWWVPHPSYRASCPCCQTFKYTKSRRFAGTCLMGLGPKARDELSLLTVLKTDSRAWWGCHPKNTWNLWEFSGLVRWWRAFPFTALLPARVSWARLWSGDFWVSWAFEERVCLQWVARRGWA